MQPELILSPDLSPSWRPRGLCVDADGVLHRGRQLLPGAVELLEELAARDIPYRIVTNNSRQRAAESAAHYRHLGLPVPPEAVLTAAEAMAAYVCESSPDARPPRVFVLGEPALRDTLRAAGCRTVRARPDFVCVGVDYHLTYQRLERASRAARECRRLIAANVDATIPRERGEIPGVGAIVAAVSIASGVEPVVAGKPAPTMFALAMRRMGLRPEDVLAIGDRLDSDILGASRAGLRSALILTGSHGLKDLECAPARPDLVFADVPQLTAWLLGREQDAQDVRDGRDGEDGTVLAAPQGTHRPPGPAGARPRRYT